MVAKCGLHKFGIWKPDPEITEPLVCPHDQGAPTVRLLRPLMNRRLCGSKRVLGSPAVASNTEVLRTPFATANDPPGRFRALGVGADCASNAWACYHQDVLTTVGDLRWAGYG